MSIYYMSLSSFCIKYKRPLCLVVFILLGIILVQVSGSIKEGLVLLDSSVCTRPTDCETCNNSYVRIGGDDIRCVWKTNSYGTRSCATSDGTTPVGEFTCPTDTSNTKPGCTPCPKLKLLDTPTWLLDQ